MIGRQPIKTVQQRNLGSPAPYSADSTAHLALDWQHLKLLADGCKDFEQELLQLFVADAAQLIAHLECAIATADVAAAKRLIHQVKGASANVGAQAMMAIATELDDRLHSSNIAGLAELHLQLKEALQVIQSFVLA
ncbi:Hpt domain-containing protein [Leptolyngbya sp. AN02str]|uniref:Hpt domain-containing protein n=1 Tax=Leptolyngbya sp. AN02str TaxID=3423363 RepID=UPI003D319CB5